MMQQLLQQWEQSTLQWMAYGCQPMQQYKMPMYACPPHEHCWEPIDTQDTECTLVLGMPPGLGTKQHEAYELSPHKDLNDRGANYGMCSTFANSTEHGGICSSSECKMMEATTAVLQTCLLYTSPSPRDRG